jgi:glycosyltransferase involved in cell wall biosynthesis
MRTPLITVLMPAYNAEKYISEAIRSVLDQTFTEFELLIINDGSTDATEQIINTFNDPRIRFINQTNQGIAAALNIGLLNARAGLIARFDADDICLSQRLEKQFTFLNAHPDYVLTGTDAVYVDMNGDFVFTPDHPAYSNEEIRKLPLEICPFSHVTVLYKKQAVIDAGMYDINAHSFEDHLLWHKLIKTGKVCNLQEVLVKVRFNPGSLTIDDKWRSRDFKKLKLAAIHKGAISKKDGDRLLNIIKTQNTDSIQRGSYYSLLAKKFLFNNYDRVKARENTMRLIKLFPLKLQGYVLYSLSWFPEKFLKSVYKIK